MLPGSGVLADGAGDTNGEIGDDGVLPLLPFVTLTVALMFCCGLVGAANVAAGMDTVYVCPSRVSEFDVTGVKEAITLELVAVNAPLSVPVKFSVPESPVPLSVIVKARLYDVGTSDVGPNTIGVVELVDVT